MKLTKQHIQQLYKFVQKHYVDWYDVQTELVDHLANGIETQWQNNKNLTFDEVLKTEFKKFGVMGFSEVVEYKTNVLNKRYRKMVWQEFKNYFKLPKIIVSLFLIWFLYQLITVLENKNFILIPIIIVLFMLPVYGYFKKDLQIKKQYKTTGKKWLFENTILQLGGIIHILNLTIQILLLLLNRNTNWSFKTEVIVASVIVAYALILYVSIYIVAPKLKQTLFKQHPEYNFT